MSSSRPRDHHDDDDDFRNGYNMWEMSQRFGKWLKYLGNGLDIWGTA